MNRISAASSSANSGADCWGQNFGYDSVYPTNLSSVTASKCTAQTFSHSITNKNRIAGFTYDNAGNVTNDGNFSYTWNALNQMMSAGGATYTYDGDGQRISDGSKLYWYGLDGSLLAETDLSGNLIREFIYFNGERVARRESNGTVYYFFSDHLGTARVMTNATGVTQQESTYYPFGGEQRQIVNNVDNRYKFTGMERDEQTGLDHTQYREYSPMLARWLSPDPICANCYDPQSLNRYSYVRNNPVNRIDPDGTQDWSPVSELLWLRQMGWEYSDAIGFLSSIPGVTFNETQFWYLRQNNPSDSMQVVWDAAAASIGYVNPGGPNPGTDGGASGGNSPASPVNRDHGNRNIWQKLGNCVKAQYGFGEGSVSPGLPGFGDLLKMGSEVGGDPCIQTSRRIAHCW